MWSNFSQGKGEKVLNIRADSDKAGGKTSEKMRNKDQTIMVKKKNLLEMNLLPYIRIADLDCKLVELIHVYRTLQYMNHELYIP